MNRIFFDQLPDDDMYNCSKYSIDQWIAMGKPNMLIGWFYICSGVIYDLLYIPVLIVMLQRKFFRRACYRIMFYLGVVDFICVTINSIICGYFTLIGSLYCTHPYFTYVAGCLSTALWTTSCATCFLLAINRCITIIRPKLADKIFAGHRTTMLLCLPTTYFLYFFLFTPPLLFSSKYYAMFFNPFMGIPGFDAKVEEARYASPAHTVNNVADVVLLSCTYITFCTLIARTPSPETTSPKQQTFVQATIICCINAVAAVIYVVMQFLETPTALIVIGQVAWQGSHGAPVFIYLCMNRTIRTAVLKLLKLKGHRAGVIVFGSAISPSVAVTNQSIGGKNRCF
uniref:Serpentine Receptor, class T n=1 Tax=Panagrellus redivivus TaxID=6233 RepID=A0A7E4W2K4_PANRE